MNNTIFATILKMLKILKHQINMFCCAIFTLCCSFRGSSCSFFLFTPFFSLALFLSIRKWQLRRTKIQWEWHKMSNMESSFSVYVCAILSVSVTLTYRNAQRLSVNVVKRPLKHIMMYVALQRFWKIKFNCMRHIRSIVGFSAFVGLEEVLVFHSIT